MKRIDLLKELGLDSSYIIHEYVETDKVIYVIANKENPKDFCNYTVGEYANRKDGKGWFTPNFYKDNDVYKATQGIESMVDKLE